MRETSFLLLCFFSTWVFSQNVKCKKLKTNTLVVLDSAVVDPQSLYSDQVKKDQIYFHSPSHQIEIVSPLDSVQICYRVMVVKNLKNREGRPLATYEYTQQAIKKTSNSPPERLLDFGENIQKNGFISRGITIGNRQNLFLNSMLNLQLKGKIGNKLGIEAVITDQNIPFQPEGNTQQLRDFDNVFIRLYTHKASLKAGDLVLRQPEDDNYFLKYYKNVQGLQFDYLSQLGNWKSTTQAAVSLAKGKFASVQLQPIEGLQGPYKLRGPNGERFIVVLANSEKIFMNGQKLQRGFENDYTIDYNLGEITFNADIIISQFSVLNVDFEYAEYHYPRTSYSFYQAMENKKVKLKLNYYREADNINRPIGFSLHENDLKTIQNIGDSIRLARIQAVDSIGFNPNTVLYRQLDTLTNDGHYVSILQYDIHPETAHYTAQFSEVGMGNGDYILEKSTSNGRIYKWISPEAGIPQGNFSPTQLVVIPFKKEMLSLGMDAVVNDHEKISQEIAFSRHDKNLYATKNDQDNEGMAWMGRIESKGRKLFAQYYFDANANWEVTHKDFSAIDRYRNILFDRDWDFDSAQEKFQYFWNLETKIFKNERNFFQYQIGNRRVGSDYHAWQHQAKFNQKIKNFQLLSQHFYLTSQDKNSESVWFRSFNDISFQKFKIIPGYIFSLDQNKYFMNNVLSSSKMHYSAHEFYVMNGDSTNTKFRFSYQKRYDKIPFKEKITDFLAVQNYTFRIKRKFKNQEVEILGTYRKTEDNLNKKNQEWINARALWNVRAFAKNVTNRMNYQLGNVRELKREYVFVAVQGNQGTHTWRDENKDGIQDLNEFYESINWDERNYAKIFMPTDEYITAFELRFQHTLNAKFPTYWKNYGGIPTLLSKCNFNLVINMHQKSTSPNLAQRINPFYEKYDDEALIFAQKQYNFQFRYNTLGKGLGWSWDWTSTANKQLLINGFDVRKENYYESKIRWRFNSQYSLFFINGWGNLTNISDFLTSRNLNIMKYVLGPEFVWQPTHNVKYIVSYRYVNKENTQIGEENIVATSNEIKSEIIWNPKTSGYLKASINWEKIAYRGAENNYIAYQMLDALQSGDNIIWQLNWKQDLGRGVNLNVNYRGRTSQDSAPIHSGTVALYAYF